MSAQEPQYLRVAAVQDHHWWFVTLRNRAATELRARVRPGSRVLDAGCGTGRMLADLTDYRRTGIDIDPDALALARRIAGDDVEWVEGSVTELPFSDAAFDAVLSLDVLYSQGVSSDLAGAQELLRVLAPNGVAILNLPAYEWLMSAHDAVARTARRYTATRLRGLLVEAGFTRVSVGYRVSTPFPVAVAHRLLTRGSDPRTDVDEVAPTVNRALTAIGRVETRLARRGVRAPFGLSVFAVAQP
jgi:SAM-dependent methyltransferase